MSVTPADIARKVEAFAATAIQIQEQRDELLNACNALLGLIQLICARSDIPAPIKLALISSHRVEEAIGALAKAGIA